MKYVATDGTVFDNRSKYRKYEMETQFTFRDKDEETLTKHPGSVQGQPFNIDNCNNCTIAILDHCDQIQIDDVSSSKIFIGASSESIFIRDCKDCSFTVACKQLRTRDCTNCTFYLYCKTDPIIETSTKMKFAPFHGAYPGHNEAMKAANLVLEDNSWHAIYDFSDEAKEGKNWSYVTREEMDEVEIWCPLGSAENCCPYHWPESTSTKKPSVVLPSISSESKTNDGQGLASKSKMSNISILNEKDQSVQKRRATISVMPIAEITVRKPVAIRVVDATKQFYVWTVSAVVLIMQTVKSFFYLIPRRK